MKAARSIAADLGLALVATLTTWVALLSWSGFMEGPGDFLGPALWFGLIVAGIGVALRRFAVPGVLVVLAQAALMTVLVTREITGSLLPVGAGRAALASALDIAMESARTYAAPISADSPPITPLLLVGAGAFLVMVDAIACTWRRVPVAGLVLLAIYSVPAGLTETGPHWAPFVGAALGFLVMLHLDARLLLTRWGRSLGPDDHDPWSAGTAVSDAVRAGALRIAAIAIGLALLAPALVPVLDVDLIGLGNGTGSGEIKIRKPRADLRRDLERGEDIPLLRIDTDDPDPSYLRIGALNRFTGNEWSSGDRDVSSDQDADRTLPMPTGLSPDVPVQTFDYRVEVTESFDSTWLPTQFPIGEIAAEGEWRYDESTFDFLGVDDENAAGSTYTMTALAPDFGTERRWFADAAAGAVSSEVQEVPGGLPSIVRTLALAVTEGALNDYDRARLLQAWFREDGGFRYNLDRAPNGAIGDTLETFLSEGPDGRVGYCEQFAAAMAIMARIVGIPARVAVGFLEPTPVGDGEWEYSSHDLHAWPELYFEGSGWVRFEPTPGRRAETAPDYTTVPVPGRPEVDPSGDPGQQPSASAQPSAGPSEPGPEQAPAPDADDADADATTGGAGARDVLGWLALVVVPVLVGALALTPRTLRRRQRVRRLAGDAEEQWAEIRATVADLGLAWPQSRSPRETGDALSAHLAPSADEESVETLEALGALVAGLERRRYARPGAVLVAEDTRTATVSVLDALESAATPRQRRRAMWLPRSLWSRRA